MSSEKTEAVHENSKHEEIETKKDMGLGVRHIQVLLMFACLTMAYGMRVTMSVAIVAMTDQETSPHPDIPTFHWDKKIQGFILSSFFWGYLLMQVPGSYVAHKYGAKILLFCVMLANGLMSILTPLAAQYVGWKCVCACRAIQGVAQGSLFPCLHSLQGRWCPINERGRLSTYVYGGCNAGSIAALSLSGFLAATMYGWPIIFYSSGALSIVLGIVWHIFGSESPADHPKISMEEKNYIQEALGQKKITKPLRIPWVQILTYMPVWAIAFSQTGSSWVTLTLFTEIPSYLSKVMDVNIKANGLLSSMPFLGMWTFSFVVSNISDRLINRGTFTIGTARKLANTIGLWGSGIGVLLLAFVPAKQVTLAVFLLTLSFSLKAVIYVGFHVNHIDISPNFSGNLMGISNCVSNTVGMMAPLTAGFVISDEKNVLQWRIVFLIAVAIIFVANLFYLVFGSADIAEWNDPEYFEKRKGLRNTAQEFQPLNKNEKIIIKTNEREYVNGSSS